MTNLEVKVLKCQENIRDSFLFYLSSKSGLGPPWIRVDHVYAHYRLIITDTRGFLLQTERDPPSSHVFPALFSQILNMRGSLCI